MKTTTETTFSNIVLSTEHGVDNDPRTASLKKRLHMLLQMGDAAVDPSFFQWTESDLWADYGWAYRA